MGSHYIYIGVFINSFKIIKNLKMRWAGHVARMVAGRGVYRVLVGKPEGKRPLGRPQA
jgi:hypothetical protein